MYIQGGSADEDFRWHKVWNIPAAIARTEAAIQQAAQELPDEEALRRLRFHTRYLEDLRRGT